MLPSQFFRKKHAQTPERRLAKAILLDAFEDLRRLKRLSIAETAIHFFFGDYRGIFSFEFLCDLFELDISRVRMRVAIEALSPNPYPHRPERPAIEASFAGQPRINSTHGRSATRDFCRHGHPMTEENTRLQRLHGKVYAACVECHRVRNRDAARRARA